MGEKLTRVGEKLTHVGEKFAHVGEKFTQVGEKLTRVGEEFARVGEEFARVGEEFTRVGEKFTQVGEEFTQVGEKLTRVGEEFTQVGEPILSMKASATCGTQNRPPAGDRDLSLTKLGWNLIPAASTNSLIALKRKSRPQHSNAECPPQCRGYQGFGRERVRHEQEEVSVRNRLFAYPAGLDRSHTFLCSGG